MTTPFLRCAEAFDAHPGDHELARLIDAIGERRALSGVGMSDRVASAGAAASPTRPPPPQRRVPRFAAPIEEDGE